MNASATVNLGDMGGIFFALLWTKGARFVSDWPKRKRICHKFCKW